jgi:hypothetical protein
LIAYYKADARNIPIPMSRKIPSNGYNNPYFEAGVLDSRG